MPLLGHAVEICDLTAGEMGSNGTPEIRMEEGRRAAAILGAKARHNLGLPDAFLQPDREALLKTAALVRQVRPDIVLAPWHRDSHPDHEAASVIVTRACHLAGLHKFPVPGQPHRRGGCFITFWAVPKKPTVLINIDAYWDAKNTGRQGPTQASLRRRPRAPVPPLLNRERFFEDYALRFRAWGREIRCTYAGSPGQPPRQIEAQDITAI